MEPKLENFEYVDDELLEQVYEGPMDEAIPKINEVGMQDDMDEDVTDDNASTAFFAPMTAATNQHTTAEMKEWYRFNHDHPPFNPDGMCLKICRVARNVPTKYPSAFTASQMTPDKYRVYKVANLRAGHVIYYDDPHDNNPFGHITSLVGRVRGADVTSLHDLLVWTNSVVAGKIVLVRGDYFKPNWGDPFVFGASWLNGVPFYDMAPKSAPPKKLIRRKRTNVMESLKSIEEGIPDLRKAVKANKGNKRVHNALERDLHRMIKSREHLKNLLAAKEK